MRSITVAVFFISVGLVYGQTSLCQTPDGQTGECVSLNSCPNLKKLLTPPVSRDTISFLKKLRCRGPDQYSVCCKPPSDDEDSDDCKAKMTAFPPSPRSGCCGVWASFGDKIVGGLDTSIYEHPWVVNIEYRIQSKNQHNLFCGGALISGKYVLTAAHCIAGAVLKTATPTTIRLGDYDITHEGKDCVAVPGGGTDCNQGAIRIGIEKTIPHPKYNPIDPSRRNDVGLIRLKETAPYTDFIRPICLPAKDLTRPENTPRYLKLDAVGWGATTENKFSDVKLKVNLPLVSTEKCRQIYSEINRDVSLWENQLCAGGDQGSDTCKGDSGGPLVYENPKLNYAFEVIGVISFGPLQCGLDGVPGVYSNVYKYIDWIHSVIVA